MKTQLTLLLFVLTSFVGCPLDQQLVKHSSPQQMAHGKERQGTSDNKPAGAYYYYLEAQIQQRMGDADKAVQMMKQAVEKDPDSRFLKKELSRLYIQQKDNQNALQIVEALLKEDPNEVETLTLYGRLMQTMKKMDDAKSAYEKVISIDPNQENIYLILGRIYMDEKDFENAFSVYQRLVKQFPHSYIGHFFLGKIYIERKDYTAAEQAFKRTLELQPDLEEPRSELIEIYKSRGLNQKVVEMYQEILLDHPDDVGARLEFGYFQHKLGHFEDAEAILMPLGSESVDDPKIIQKVIQLYLNPKKYEESLVILNYMLSGAPESSDLNYLVGVTYSGLEKDNQALPYFQKVKDGSRFYQNAVVHIAFLYQEQGQTHQAIQFLTDARKNLPESPDILLYLGSFYEEIEEFEKAIKVLKEGIDLDPNHARLYFRLGVVYDKWGKKDNSIATMKKVIELDPKNANALNYLGYTYADLGKNLDEAERLIKEAITYKPDDGYITDSLGWVYYKKGEYEKALELLIKAATLVPDDPIILEHVGDAYLKTNNKDKALEYYRRSLLHKKKNKGDIEKKIQTLTGKESQPL